LVDKYFGLSIYKYDRDGKGFWWAYAETFDAPLLSDLIWPLLAGTLVEGRREQLIQLVRNNQRQAGAYIFEPHGELGRAP
jgi:hypothetical protein